MNPLNAVSFIVPLFLNVIPLGGPPPTIPSNKTFSIIPLLS
jgi:hypothetical protein